MDHLSCEGMAPLSFPRGENFNTVVGDEEGVLPLGAGASVLGAGGPQVGGIDDGLAYPGVDHRFDGEGHPCGEGDLDVVVTVRNLGGFVEADADAMTNKLVDDRTSFAGGVVLDHLADVADENPWLKDGDTLHQRFVGDIDDELALGGGLADDDHLAAVAIVAIEDTGDVDVADVPLP